MSTKIYEGMMFNDPNVNNIFKQLKQFQPQVQEAAKQYVCQNLANRCVTYLDNLFVTETCNTNETIFRYHMGEYYDETYELARDQYFQSAFDIRFSIAIFPISRRKTLAIPFYRQNELMDHFNKLNITREYGYWNNTDMPSFVTRREWRQRKRDWDIALPDSTYSIPSLSGLMCELSDNRPFVLNYDMLEPYFASHSARVKSLAHTMAFNQCGKIVGFDNKNVFLSSVTNYFKSDDGQQIFNDYMQRFAEILPKTITRQMITTTLDENYFDTIKNS